MEVVEGYGHFWLVTDPAKVLSVACGSRFRSLQVRQV